MANAKIDNWGEKLFKKVASIVWPTHCFLSPMKPTLIFRCQLGPPGSSPTVKEGCDINWSPEDWRQPSFTVGLLFRADKSQSTLGFKQVNLRVPVDKH
jgi:hypothetical protein